MDIRNILSNCYYEDIDKKCRKLQLRGHPNTKLTNLILHGQSEYINKLLLRGHSQYFIKLLLRGHSQYIIKLLLRGH